MHEHAFHFAVAGRIDAQRAAPDGLALATRDEETDVGRTQRVDVEDVVAFRGVERLEIGVDRFDTAVLDLAPENAKRYDAAAGRVLELLSARRKAESDPRVRDDLDLLIDAVESRRRTRALEYRLLIPYFDLPRHIFEGLKVLLDARNGESRRRNALQRLRRYAGTEPGTAPLADPARARMRERFRAAELCWPDEGKGAQ